MTVGQVGLGTACLVRLFGDQFRVPVYAVRPVRGRSRAHGLCYPQAFSIVDLTVIPPQAKWLSIG
jgi:hypothetical protein